LKSWFSPSGGLAYHLKARKNRNSLWLPFTKKLNDFAEEWIKSIPHPEQKTLLLFGGSGGHTLTTSFLSKFQKVIHIDKDPLAKFFFRRRHHLSNIEFINENIFDKDLHIKEKFLAAHPPHSTVILWSNLLGQIGFYFDAPSVKALLSHIHRSMRAYSWMSFHDVYSVTPLKIREEWMKRGFSCPEEVPPFLFENLQKKSVVIDHLTQKNFDFERSLVLTWALDRKSLHFVECGCSPPSSTNSKK